ncbi:transglycosylase domain-containing protein [Patescibacteria group bacterium]|nr:transglycosylase domain-containing protein [Patescibacteria group bacterium]
MKNLILLAVVLGVAGSLFLLGLFAFISRDLPDPNSLTERSISQSTKIYDRTGEHLLYEIFGDENRTLVKIQEGFCNDDDQMEKDLNGIPLFVLQATIAAEDRKFCSHHGFSFTGLLRAVVYRGKKGGGSTLTQQLVKNAILSPERTVIRKIKELLISLELERRYSKDEILQIYFNEIPYGSTYYGVQAAAQNYFGKTVDQLTLAEAATLAALPQAPTAYLNDQESLETRRNWILDGMVDLEFISREEADKAKAEITPVEVSVTNIKAPHFVFYVKEMLEEEYGQRMVEDGGLKVITTIDFEKQEAAEEAVWEGVEANGEALGFNNASLVAIDPKNGQILAMVGSKDYFDDEIDGMVNVSTRLRQPGSSIKPIVYAKAFDMGYTPNTVLWDVKTDFPTATGNYSPNNYDLKERGPIRVRDAIQGSLNIPAVKMLYMVGVENALGFAEDLGYTSFADRSRFGLAIVLGGGEVKLLEHVNAFAAFANEGVHYDPVVILKVEDAEGQVLREWKETSGYKVMDENVARMMTNVLSDNAARTPFFGSNSPLTLGGRPVAAKTGTTNDYHDAWTVGYTPSLAAGVWGGNNDNAEMHRGAGGSTVAGPIWNSFMRKALEGEAVESFTAPNIPITGKAVLDGQLEQKQVTVDKITGKLATEYTPPQYKEEKLFAQYHSLLHYVDRSDVLGAAPGKPDQDPYYKNWEAAIEIWIQKKQEETGVEIMRAEAPTEFDDVHVPENFPSVQINSPRDNTDINDRGVMIEVEAEAARGVARVEFYLDGFFLGYDQYFPYNLQAIIPNTVERGYHTLKVVAYDDVGNSGSDTEGLRIMSEAAASGFEIIDPKNGQTIEWSEGQNEFDVVVSIDQPTKYRLVTVLAQPIGLGDQQSVAAKINPESPFLTFTWGLPSSGDWALRAVAEEKNGGQLETAGIVVHVVAKAAVAASEAGTGEEGEIDLPVLNPFAEAPAVQ